MLKPYVILCIADLAVIIMLSCSNPGSNCTTISNVTINCNNNNNVFNQRMNPTPGETATSFNFSQPAVSANTPPSITTPSITTPQTQFVKPPIFNDLCNSTPYNNSGLQQQENLYKFNSLDFEFKSLKNEQSTTPQLPAISINDNFPNSLTSSSYTTPYKNESTYNNIISPITGSATPQLLDDKHNRTSKQLKIQYIYDKFSALWDPTLTNDDNYEILADLEKFPIFDPYQINWNAALSMYQQIKINQFEGSEKIDATSAVYFNLTQPGLIPYVNWDKYIDSRSKLSINHNNKNFSHNNNNLKLGPSHGVSGGVKEKNVSKSKARRNRKKRKKDGRNRQLQSSQQQSDDDDDDVSGDNDEEMKDESEQSTKDADAENDNDQQQSNVSQEENDNNINDADGDNDHDDDDDDDDDSEVTEEDDDLNAQNNADNDNNSNDQDDNDIEMDDNNSEGLLYYIDFSQIFVYQQIN